MGHETVMGKVSFFWTSSRSSISTTSSSIRYALFDPKKSWPDFRTITIVSNFLTSKNQRCSDSIICQQGLKLHIKTWSSIRYGLFYHKKYACLEALKSRGGGCLTLKMKISALKQPIATKLCTRLQSHVGTFSWGVSNFLTRKSQTCSDFIICQQRWRLLLKFENLPLKKFYNFIPTGIRFACIL